MGTFKPATWAGLFGLAVFSASPAFAADLLLPPPPPPPEPIAFLEVGSGWYLRGDIGFSNQSVDKLDNALSTTRLSLDKSFDAAPIVGVGVGYRFNSWLRADVTGEYRAKANFKGLEIYADPFSPGGRGTDEYTATKSEAVALANVYFDLGTWHGITPFVGAGVGLSRNTIANFTDINTPNAGVAYGKTDSRNALAWALHAGIGYEVSPNFTIEMAYRYIHLGNGQSGDLITYTGVNNVYNPMKFKDISSHDFKIAMRWALGGPVRTYEQEPIITKY